MITLRLCTGQTVYKHTDLMLKNPSHKDKYAIQYDRLDMKVVLMFQTAQTIHSDIKK